jgi:uncharacterized protein (TIGR03083 family)
MSTSSVAETQLGHEVVAERRELADVLAALTPQDWDAPSLCEGWRAREVLAHITMTFSYATEQFGAEMAQSGGDFNAMADRCARRDAAGIPIARHLDVLRDDSAYPWRVPSGQDSALTHTVIHGLDITVPLGIGRRVPEERMLLALRILTEATALGHFGTDLSGIELRADDLDWSFGSGELVCGDGQDLALVLGGRKLPPGRLRGAASGRFTDRGEA